MKALLKPCLLVAGLVIAQLAAAQSSAVSSTLQARRVENVNGKVVLTSADVGKPGDLVEYSGTYRNGGSKPVDKLVATIPVPPGTTYVSGSAEPGKATASVDGVRYAPMPLKRTVRQADGTSREEPVPVTEYRFIRWDIGSLGAGSESVVKLWVRIDAAATASAANVKP
ncbi:hypothetical protein H8N03_00305 [Ramlibacter sp. USB13]|uniref:DUF11 domain-containing protein n=1 Tax=Ramlibacter cellulosilyticus TaxID=2764187 RepID=A0A923S969_9BURK|nr:hypothetical protein [Ramlibacter cellulosilyticus]MBC5781361.1 hypothetical protein [Ramlibacter cellulosilyticus]